jgi:hypothetical protein
MREQNSSDIKAVADGTLECSKRYYSSPQLHIYGSLIELTEGGHGAASDFPAAGSKVLSPYFK